MKTFSYERMNSNLRSKEIIDLGPAGSFNKVIYNNEEPEEIVIAGALFKSYCSICNPSGKKVVITFKSEDAPNVLYMESRDYVYLNQIEVGGDLMIQAFHEDNNLEYLLIDNTYVLSGWMQEKTFVYLNNAWYPGLVQVGLKGIAHLQAESLLGGMSFEKFGEAMMESLTSIAGDAPFTYSPIKTSEINKDGVITGDNIRQSALEEGFKILTTS